MKQVTDDGRLVDFLPPDPLYLRRQNLPTIFHVSGAMYLSKRELLFRQDSFYTDKTYVLDMPIERAIDVDTWYDFKIVELMMSLLEVGTAG